MAMASSAVLSSRFSVLGSRPFVLCSLFSLVLLVGPAQRRRARIGPLHGVVVQDSDQLGWAADEGGQPRAAFGVGRVDREGPQRATTGARGPLIELWGQPPQNDEHAVV